MVYLFEETAQGSRKFHQAKTPVLPDRTKPEMLWAKHKTISKAIVSKALDVCIKTYDENFEGRVKMGGSHGTWCVTEQEDNILYIGIRGSAEHQDWLSNFNFHLVEELQGNGQVKV